MAANDLQTTLRECADALREAEEALADLVTTIEGADRSPNTWADLSMAQIALGRQAFREALASLPQVVGTVTALRQRFQAAGQEVGTR